MYLCQYKNYHINSIYKWILNQNTNLRLMNLRSYFGHCLLMSRYRHRLKSHGGLDADDGDGEEDHDYGNQFDMENYCRDCVENDKNHF